MKLQREIYEDIKKRTFDCLIRYNPTLARNEYFVDRFNRAANLVAVETTVQEWKNQYKKGSNGRIDA